MDKIKVTLVSKNTDNPIDTIANVASICYDSHPKNRTNMVHMLWKNGHQTPFEFVDYTFLIDGCSRACANQLLRHRMCSFMQRSQRYCSEDGFDFVIPNTIDENIVEYVGKTFDGLRNSYQQMTEQGVKNEDARIILPNACRTKLYLKCNLRELSHIANERLCTRAQDEIRHVVDMMCKLLPEEVQFILTPRCGNPCLKCNNPCK